MKKILFLALALTLVATFSNAQSNVKVGYINSQELLSLMPENDSVQAKVQRHIKALQQQLESMQSNLEKKYQDFQAKEKTLTGVIKQTKMAELQKLDQNLKTFQANADQDWQQKRSELMKPVVEKATKAINDVAKENGFTFILDESTGSLIYKSEACIDILPLVKSKLGITATKAKTKN